MTHTTHKRRLGPRLFTILLTSVVTISVLNIPVKLSAQSVTSDKHLANIAITDNATAPANPIDQSNFFVRQHYIDFLTRNPDSNGLNFWTNQIQGCGGVPSCVERERVLVSGAFFLSIEFQNSGYLVYRAHQAAFNIGPSLGRDEFIADMRKLIAGVVVGVGNWEQQLQQNRVAYFNEFMTRQAFTQRFPPSQTAAQFVDGLNQNTRDPLNPSSGGSLSTSERNALVNDLTSGVITRAQALSAIAQNANFHRREFNRAFVLMQYFGYLKRNPNAFPDTNFDGYNFWLNKLNQFNGDFVRAEMVRAFISSIEYRQRFTTQPGTTFTLFTNRNDPLLLRAQSPNGSIVEYYGEKNNDGLATTVSGFRVQRSNGEATTYLLDAQRRPIQALAANGVVLRFNWQSNSTLIVTVVSADGNIQVNSTINLLNSSVTAASVAKASQRLTRQALSLPKVTSTPTPLPATIAPTDAATNLSAITVAVSKCNSPVNDATVFVGADAGLQSGTFPGTFIGNGNYRVLIPSFDSDAGSRIQEKCESIAQILDFGCIALQALGPAQALICPALSVAVGSIPGGAVAVPAIFTACSAILVGLDFYCATLGASPIEGGPSLTDFFCDAVTAIDRAPTSPITLRPSAHIPGQGFVNGTPVTAPAAGPFPNLSVTSAGAVAITSFTVNPVNPAAGQSYVATARVGCAPSNTRVDISISGTDGFSDSTSCFISGDANCSLTVPGAESGVVDTLIVKVQNGPTRTIINVFR